MKKNSNNQNFKTMMQKTRPVQIAILVIAIAVGSVMIFNGGKANSTNPKTTKANAAASTEDSKVINLTDAIFDSTIAEGVVLVDFWAVWCPPCRIQNPIIEQVALEIGEKAKIAKLDVDHNPRSASVHRVQNIPTLLIFKDGEVVQRFVGVQQKETLLAAIQSHI
jgi:thioredoxin 1